MSTHCVWYTTSRLLSTAQGSLLDDEVLVNTLQSSKRTSEDVSEQLQVAEQTEAKIDAAREVRERVHLVYVHIHSLLHVD